LDFCLVILVLFGYMVVVAFLGSCGLVFGADFVVGVFVFVCFRISEYI